MRWKLMPGSSGMMIARSRRGRCQGSRHRAGTGQDSSRSAEGNPGRRK
jgi:hypothetical protein